MIKPLSILTGIMVRQTTTSVSAVQPISKR
jgi:hypothetical protein